MDSNNALNYESDQQIIWERPSFKASLKELAARNLRSLVLLVFSVEFWRLFVQSLNGATNFSLFGFFPLRSSLADSPVITGLLALALAIFAGYLLYTGLLRGFPSRLCSNGKQLFIYYDGILSYIKGKILLNKALDFVVIQRRRLGFSFELRACKEGGFSRSLAVDEEGKGLEALKIRLESLQKEQA